MICANNISQIVFIHMVSIKQKCLIFILFCFVPWECIGTTLPWKNKKKKIPHDYNMRYSENVISKVYNRVFLLMRAEGHLPKKFGLLDK